MAGRPGCERAGWAEMETEMKWFDYLWLPIAWLSDSFDRSMERAELYRKQKRRLK